MNTSADVHTLTGAYALNALPQEDRERFERHLAECPTCAEEVGEFGEVLARLGSATAEEPPQWLRDDVLAAARGTRQLPPDVRAEQQDDLAGKRAVRQESWWRRPSALLAAAAVVAAVLLGYQAAVSDQRLDELRGTGEAYAALTEMLAVPDARVISGAATGGGSTTAVVSHKRELALIIGSDLPDPPGDRAYQVWVMSPQPRSAGLLPATAQPHAQLVAHGVKPGDKLGVTIEPAGGSAQPTSSPIVLMQL